MATNPKPPGDRDAAAAKKRPRGRPRLGEEPLTDAQRAARYRELMKARAFDAAVSPEEHSRATLMASLTMCLERLDNYKGKSKIVRDNMRNGARLLINEIVTRYGI